jgi:hypothetical protein
VKSDSGGAADPMRPSTLTTLPVGQGHGMHTEDTSIGVSMYHSAVGSLFGGRGEQGPSDTKGAPLRSVRQTSTQRSLPDLGQRLLVASEKQISAKFSIAEVLLTLSSAGEIVASYRLLPDVCLIDAPGGYH